MEGTTNHIIPFNVYVKVILTLLALTVLTVAVAKPVSGFDAGIFNALIAMVIASIKAGIVGAWFMHLKYEKTKAYLGLVFISVFFLILMFSLCWIDIITRVNEVSTL